MLWYRCRAVGENVVKDATSPFLIRPVPLCWMLSKDVVKRCDTAACAERERWLVFKYCDKYREARGSSAHYLLQTILISIVALVFTSSTESARSLS